MREKARLDGEPGELVAEGHAVAVATNDAGLETGVQVLELLGHDRFQEPQFGAERHDRDRVEQPSRRLGEQRAVRARTASLTVSGSSPPPAAKISVT